MDSGRYLGKLASLRFFAALLVMLFHLRVFVHPQDDLGSLVYFAMFSYGHAGVCIFFVLSGFVISYANDNWKGWKVYIIGRLSRIYPLHWIVLFIVAGYSVAALFASSRWGLSAWEKLFANMALLQAWIPDGDYYFSFDVVSWSLSVEIFFYLCFIFLRRFKDEHLLVLSILSYGALLVVAYELLGLQPIVIYWAIYINPLARLPEFLVGMTIYRFYKKGSLPEIRLGFAVILGGLVACLAIIRLVPLRETSIWFKDSVTYSIVPLPFAVLMLMSLLGRSSNQYMKSQVLTLLGEASFSLYLIHRPIIDYVGDIIVRNPDVSEQMRWILIVTLIPLFIAASVLIYKFIEVPMTKALKGFLIEKLA